MGADFAPGRARAGGTLDVGMGGAGHHHGELLQGAVVRDGDVVSCLITMPVGAVGSRARYWPRAGAANATLEVAPPGKTKALRAARLALQFVEAPVTGRLEIECAVATGVGLGSSTCDVVAAIRAVCEAHRVTLGASDVARLAIAAEGAADPIMFDGEMVLFAQRLGRVLESFGAWVPRYTVLSIDTDHGDSGVDTLSLPLPAYTAADLSAFERLVTTARDAFLRRDCSALATVATQSAEMNQRFLRVPHFHEIRQLAAENEALGVQISHSGTLVGMLFDAATVLPDGPLVASLAEQVRALGLRPLGLFSTGMPSAD